MAINPTPWRLVNDVIHKVEIVDANDEVIVSQPRACDSSSWKSLDDMYALKGIDASKRQEWGDAIQNQLDTLNGIIEAVNEKFEPVAAPKM
jgi:hypothetical protein